MQLVCFHLMPWPHLPADFEQQYDSAWLTLPNTLFDPERGRTLYTEYLEQLVTAERLGFDVIGVNEHHQNAYGLTPSPNIMAAALTKMTSRVKILVLGSALPLYDHPLRVAEEVAMLDVMSGGRMIAGMVVGLGVEAYSYHCGYNVPHSQIGWPAMIYVGETDTTAREEFEPHFWYLAKKGLRLPREYMFPPGHTSVESQLRPGHAKRKFISLISSWKEAEEGGYAIVGSAETVRQKLREGIKRAGCGIIQGIFQVGSMPHEMTLRNMERFARHVMPALREEFPQ